MLVNFVVFDFDETLGFCGCCGVGLGLGICVWITGWGLPFTAGCVDCCVLTFLGWGLTCFLFCYELYLLRVKVCYLFYGGVFYFIFVFG